MICPKCGANNPKDPLQCIRCGFIFQEYIDKHNIDMTRSVKENSAPRKTISFTPEVKHPIPSNPSRAVTSNVSRVPVRPGGVVNAPKQDTPVIPVPTKIKKVIFIGRNGINRFEEIKECFIVSLIYTAILIIGSYIYIHFM